MHFINAHHTITLQRHSHNVRHRAFAQYFRARVYPRNARNSVRWHAHICQDVRERIILKKTVAKCKTMCYNISTRSKCTSAFRFRI